MGLGWIRWDGWEMVGMGGIGGMGMDLLGMVRHGWVEG